MVSFTEPFRATFRVTFLLGCGEVSAGLLSRLTPCRSTPIATMALPFNVKLTPG